MPEKGKNLIEHSQHTLKKAYTSKVHIYVEYHIACPLVRTGTPHPISPECAPPPPEPKGEGTHSPACQGMGGGGPNSDGWRKSVVLCLLCDIPHTW